jgi:hypothetical protein
LGLALYRPVRRQQDAGHDDGPEHTLPRGIVQSALAFLKRQEKPSSWQGQAVDG